MDRGRWSFSQNARSHPNISALRPAITAIIAATPATVPPSATRKVRRFRNDARRALFSRKKDSQLSTDSAPHAEQFGITGLDPSFFNFNSMVLKRCAARRLARKSLGRRAGGGIRFNPRCADSLSHRRLTPISIFADHSRRDIARVAKRSVAARAVVCAPRSAPRAIPSPVIWARTVAWILINRFLDDLLSDLPVVRLVDRNRRRPQREDHAASENGNRAAHYRFSRALRVAAMAM